MTRHFSKKLLVYVKGGKTFGKNQWYPKNSIAELFCAINGKKCLGIDIIDMLLKFDFRVEYYGKRCPALDERGAVYRGDMKEQEQEQEIVEE